MMIWLRIILTLSLVAPPALAKVEDSPDNKQTVTNKAIFGLQLLLLDPVPLFYGSEKFFNQTLFHNSNKLPAGLSEEDFKNDSNFFKAIAEGRFFRNQYQKLIQTHFSQSQDFIYNPETAALTYIQNLNLNKNKMRTQRPLSELEVRTMAFREALLKHSLPSSLSWTQLENLARSESRAQLAIHFYNRRYFQLSSQEFDVHRPKEPSVAEIKTHLRHVIEQARLRNFQAQILVFLDQVNEHAYFYFSSSSNGLPTVLGLDQLKKAKVKFLDTSTATHKLEVGKSRGTWSDVFEHQFTRARAWQFKDNKLAKDFYDIPKSALSSFNSFIELSLEDETKVVIGEKDFVTMLREMNTGLSLGEDVNRTVSRRFLIEGISRDQQLAEFLLALNERDDFDKKYLVQRIQDRIQQMSRFSSEGHRSLTQILREANFRFNDSAMALIYWSGTTLSPDYWRARDVVASNLGQPAWGDNEKTLNRQLGPREKKIREKAFKKQSAIASHRLKDEQGKHQAVTHSRTRNILFALSLMGISTYGLFDQFGDTNISDISNEKPVVSSPFIDFLFGWLKISGDNGQGSSGNGSTSYGEDGIFDPNQPPEAINHRIPHGGQSVTGAIRITHIGKGLQVPLHFNLATRTNFSKEVLADMDPETEPSFDVESLSVKYAGWTMEGESSNDPKVVVESRLKSRLIGQRLPIVTFDSGYRLEGLTLFKDGEVYYSGNYRVYELKKTSLYYVELQNFPENGISSLTYRAVYVPDENKKSQPRAHLNHIRAEFAQPLNNQLRQSGFYKLATNLDHLMSKQRLISTDALQQVFNESSIYTFKSGPSIPAHLDMDFSEYSVFLKNGVAYMQCTGGNALFSTYLYKYYAMFPGENPYSPKIEIESLHSYPVDPLTLKSKSVGHVRTQLLLTEIGPRWSMRYFKKILDGTPNPDPFDNPVPYNPLKAQAMTVALRSRPPEITTVPQDREKEKQLSTLNHDKVAELGSTEIHQRLAYLQQLKSQQLNIFSYLQENSTFLSVNLSKMDHAILEPENIPGLATVRFVSVLEKYLKGEMDLTSALAGMMLAGEKWPFTPKYERQRLPELKKVAEEFIKVNGENSLQIFFKEYFNSLKNEYGKLTELMMNRHVDPKTYDYKVYLADPELQRLLQSMSQVMNSTPWYKGIPVSVLCEEALEGK